MEERTHHEEHNENNGRHASRRSDAQERDVVHRLHDQENERPALTRREREDPWPIG